ncbi:hypothetical protein EGH22_09665 [Halomicroarcula sp. F28]|uniref:hypothetical protein n=1 Tax=Haloarcula salinisoli TaxID=2487746 RepID=UPI001C739E8D|nr:hypothetical protein [Halomicroarcula salinisoli]MBX0286593.1 hypothetical protein [Halomicroarcula salinisoli]
MTPQNRLALSKPLDSPDVPVVEMVSTTRRNETRSVMALVATLLNQDVPVRDIAVVVRDLDPYEEPLFRAALQHGVVPDFWTQLRVTQTRPFNLVVSICDVLAADSIDKHTLSQPLEHRWTPSEASKSKWPIEPKTVQQTVASLPDDGRTLAKWADWTAQNDEIDDRIELFVRWLDEVPDPRPDTISSVLTDVVDAYATHGLPETETADSPALLETETDARAALRVETLVEQLRHKFADRLDEGAAEQSWADVAELASLIATQRPGRREHSHARAVDVLEANDVWGLDIPYVIVVGLTASEWPQDTDSTTQPEFEEAILTGSGEASKLAPDTSWTDARDRDHLGDALTAASSGVIITRHEETTSGDVVHPSPFLEFIDPEVVPDAEIQQLRSSECSVPPAVQAMLSESMETETDD